VETLSNLTIIVICDILGLSAVKFDVAGILQMFSILQDVHGGPKKSQ
jgi:hypothetical protein